MNLSIITPSFNSEKTIERAIKSVLEQKIENFEHIIVDGGSNDGTIEILKKYPKIKWISETDNGQVDAMNKGFRMSRGDIIGNLNADDYYLPGAFNAIKPYFESSSDFVMGKVKVVSEGKRNPWINDPEYEIQKMLKHWAPNAFCVNPVGYFYRRSIQDNIPFNPENDDKHDLEFLLEVASKYKIEKIDMLLGVFSHNMNTKTFREQSWPSYWQNENFDFIDRFLDKMPHKYKRLFNLERDRGYQLRRHWVVYENMKLGKTEDLLRKNELFFLPEDGDESYHNRCGFVDFTRIATKGDWIIPVLTVGKVASNSICHALKDLPDEILPAQSYHIHSTNERVIRNLLPMQLPSQTQAANGFSLKKIFLKKKNDLKWKFIAGVREPIACGVSGYFEINKGVQKNMYNDIKLKITNYILNFFECEYKESIGIDVYGHEFDHKKGYTIIKSGNIELMIYRYEDLTRIFSKSMDEFLGISKMELPKVNVSSDKGYANEYKVAKNDIRFDKKFLDGVYLSKMVKHFYTEEEIHGFYDKWLEQNNCQKIKKKWHGLIYDIGMHEGQDTEYYLKKNFQVVAVDANPTAVDAALKKFKNQIASGQLVVLNVGVAEKISDKKLTFYVNDKHSEWSSFIKEIATRDSCPYHTIEISCSTMGEIVKKYGTPYYVKIDIEGHDLMALRSLIESNILPQYISVENGNMGMLKMLAEKGYTGFKYIQQNNITEVQLPYPAKEGCYVEHSFQFGASGPFGEETSGNWKDFDDVVDDISKVWDPNGDSKNENHDDALHGWFDLHAKL